MLGHWHRIEGPVMVLAGPGTGKTHIATALGINACQRGYNTRFFTATGLVNALVEARSETDGVGELQVP